MEIHTKIYVAQDIPKQMKGLNAFVLRHLLTQDNNSFTRLVFLLEPQTNPLQSLLQIVDTNQFLIHSRGCNYCANSLQNYLALPSWRAISTLIRL